MAITTVKNETLQGNSTMQKTIQTKFRALKALIILTIYVIYEVIFVHKFFVHTFFRSSISDVPPPVKLNIGYWNKLQFKTILLMRYLLKDQFWGQQWLKRIHDQILNNLNKQNIEMSKLNMPIPTLKPKEISAQEFCNTYVKTNTPVIIKGGAKHSFAYRNWTMETFQKRFGDFKVNIAKQTIDEHNVSTFQPEIVTLQDVIDNRESKENLYIAFCAEIFTAYPELVNELGCLEFRKHMGGNYTLFGGAQLFLGTKASTGTHAHCANSNNLFFQICGKKKWTFVHPDYLWLMYPMLDRFFLFCASFIKQDYDQTYLEQYAPLQKYCPKYEAILEPGDILLNPPWQWHAIENLTEETIAIATRWADTIGQKRANTFFEFMQLFSPHMWRMKFGALKKAPNAVGLFDENTGDLVKSSDDFVGLGKEDRIIAWELDKWPKEYQF
ncbi:hypothetical protein AMR41_19605 [Hapalosiphon sp. MRB220]|nr:hypothetical protein AMR41_19605 [Hapalosiphon sp. MRB220]